MARAESYDVGVVDWPTLGYLGADWIAQHCPIPDGFHRGEPYVMADWQLWCACNHYRVREEAVWDEHRPVVSTNFYYRRSQVVAPQKTGKGPWLAAIIRLEAQGPTVFIGFAKGGERYRCKDWLCECGWEYVYEADEPMGMPRPTPLIQLTATSRDQTGNVYRPLKAMLSTNGVHSDVRAGVEFINLPDGGRIETVTSNALSRLGNPITFCGQDESGLYTKTNGMVAVADTQNRGLAGMDARGIETTNCWDPSEQSTGQTTFESSLEDIFRFYRRPPAHLSYANPSHRRAIHKYVYEGSWWVNLDAIEGLALELIERGDAAQAERFYGNRVRQTAGAWMPDELWEASERLRTDLDLGLVVSA